MKLDIQSVKPGFEIGTFEVAFRALNDDGTPLLNASGAKVCDNPGLTHIITIPPDANGAYPEGEALSAAVLEAVQRFAVRRILPASVVTPLAAPGIVDGAPVDADAPAPVEP